MIVGLTGGIGTGKSAVTEIIRKHTPHTVFDCDAKVAEYYEDPMVIHVLTATFGDLGANPKATVAKLAWEGGSDNLSIIAAFMSGRLIADISAFINGAKKDEILILDAPTLFESGLNKAVQKIITVTAPPETRWERVKGRPNMTAERYNTVLSHQYRDEDRLGDYMINNDGSLNDLKISVLAVIKEIENDAHNR